MINSNVARQDTSHVSQSRHWRMTGMLSHMASEWHSVALDILRLVKLEASIFRKRANIFKYIYSNDSNVNLAESCPLRAVQMTGTIVFLAWTVALG